MCENSDEVEKLSINDMTRGVVGCPGVGSGVAGRTILTHREG